MARYTPIKNSFVAGELSPRLEGRDDLDQYFQGMRQAENGIVLPHGGFMRRSGTRYVGEVKDMAKRVRLIDFEASTDQAYVCEFGNLYVRFFTNEGVLGAPFEVVTPFLESELADLQYVQDQDVMYVGHENHPPYKLTRTSPTTFTMAKVAFRDGHAPMRPDNLTATTLTVTGAANPRTLTWSADIGLTSGADVGRMVRFKDAEWYLITGVTSGAIATATSQTNTTPTLGAADANWALGMFSDSEGPLALAFHEGRLGYFGSRTVVNWYALSVSDDFDNFVVGPEDDKAILKRLTAGKGDKIKWAKSADEVLIVGTGGTEFRITAQGDDIVTPSSTKAKPSTSRGSAHIQALAIDSEVLFIQRSGKKLRVLTYDLEKDGRIARDISILAEHILKAGGVELHYQQDPDSIVWVLRADGVLVGFTYEREQKVNGAHRQKLGGTFGSEAHAIVESMCVIPSPDGTSDQVWLAVKRTINGATKRYIEFFMPSFQPALERDADAAERSAAMEATPFSDCSLSLDLPLDITAISKANPGVFTSAAHGLVGGDTVRLRYIGSFVGTTAAPSMSTLNNISYTVGNATANTFTLIGPDGLPVDTTDMQDYIGSGMAAKETTTITGLGHLEGEEVAIQADGASHPRKTVVGGQITLDYPASFVHVGLPYTSKGETLRFVGGSRMGTDQGKPQRIQRLIARVHETVGGLWRQGTNPNKELVAKPIHSDDENTDTAPPFFSGDIELSPEGGWNEDPTIYFEQPEPLPMTVLALMIWGDSRER